MRKVLLYGELGEKYGREFNLHVKTLRQALSLLSANFPDFKHHLVDSDSKLLGYTVWDGSRDVEGKEEDFLKEGEGDIKIIPVLKGSSSTARIILGVVLVVVGVLGTYLGWWAGGSAWGPYLIGTGIALIAGGVAEKLSSKPKTPETQDVASATSYIFSGSQNNTRQGSPVAIGYGKFLVGSNVISSNITSSDIPV